MQNLARLRRGHGTFLAAVLTRAIVALFPAR